MVITPGQVSDYGPAEALIEGRAGEGDTVRVVECRPMSRPKRWRLTDVLERAR